MLCVCVCKREIEIELTVGYIVRDMAVYIPECGGWQGILSVVPEHAVLQSLLLTDRPNQSTSLSLKLTHLFL